MSKQIQVSSITPATTQQTQAVSKRVSKQQLENIEEDKKFSSTLIVNFLNAYYHNESVNSKSLVFKTYPTKPSPTQAKKPVIDLYNYQGLIDFIETYKIMSGDDWTKIIEHVFDLKLHTCLDIADKYKTNDKKKLNVFQEFIIPQLGFEKMREIKIQDFIKAIDRYFENDAKLKTKIYNSVFPHDTHHEEELPKGVNVIYLQHVSKYHDEVLDMVINQEMDDREILGEIQKLYSKNYKFDNTGAITPDVRERAITQMLNPKIADSVLNPPVVKDKKGRDLIDTKWIDNLMVVAVNKRTNKFTDTTEPISLEEKKNIRDLVRELNIVKSFIKIIRGGANARKLVREKVIMKNKDGEDVEQIIERAEPINVDFKFCLNQYQSIYNQTREFHDNWVKIIQEENARINIAVQSVRASEPDALKAEEKAREEGERLTYELFLRYFINSVKFIQDKFNCSTALKTFITELQKDMTFKFNKNLRIKIKKLVSQDVPNEREEIAQLARDYYKEWELINSPKNYDFNELDIYAKIGQFCGVPIKKDYRIGIGIAIIAYIQEQIKIINAASTARHEIQIFIKV